MDLKVSGNALAVSLTLDKPAFEKVASQSLRTLSVSFFVHSRPPLLELQKTTVSKCLFQQASFSNLEHSELASEVESVGVGTNWLTG